MKPTWRTLVGSDGSLLGIGEKVSVLEGLGRVSNQTRDVYEMWSRAGGADRLPPLADVPVDQLTGLLDAVIVVDVLSDARDYRYRRCGELEITVRGGDPVGKTVRECHAGEILDFVLENYDRVVASREGLLDFSIDLDRHQRYVTNEVMFLPLSENGTDVTQILVYCHYRDTATSTL